MEPLAAELGAHEQVRWFNTLQDITETVAAEERIKRLNRIHAVLSGINAAIVRIRGREELFRESCRIAVEAGRFLLGRCRAVHRDPSRAWRLCDPGDARDFF